MVEITKIEFTDSFTGTGATKSPFLIGSIGDLMQAWVDISIHWESLAVLVVFDMATSTITRKDNRSWLADGFRTGDTFDIVNSPSNDGSYTIASITASTITTVEALVTETASGVDFHGTTPVTTLDFYYNLIGNQQQFDLTSLTDSGTLQKQSAYKAVWSDTDIVTASYATVSKGWTQAQAAVEKISTTNYAQIFQIRQIFAISPLFLSGQQTGLQNNPLTAPSYFAGDNCLKFICRTDAKFDQLSPQIVHTTDPNYPFAYGNTGYFNEFMNGGTPDYTLVSTVYTDVATSQIIAQPDFNRDTLVTMVIHSAAGSFSAGSKISVNMAYCPLDLKDYTNTRTDFKTNFKFDRSLTTVGAGATNGWNYGTDIQSIKTITATFDSANQITVTFTISLASAYKSFLQFKSQGNWNYIFWATPQSAASVKLGDTDRNAVLGDFNSFIYDRDDATLLTWSDIKFFQDPETVANPKTDYKGIIGDNVLTNSQFTIDNGSVPLDLTAEIRVVNTTTLEYFTLERYQQQFPQSELSGQICASNKPTILGYKLPDDDKRNQAYLYRNVAIDTASQLGFQFDYGFVARYETWRDVPEYPVAFACDHSQDWSIYSSTEGWSIKYVVTINVQKNNYITSYQRTSDILLQDGDFTDNGYGTQITPIKQTFYYSGLNLVDAKGLIFTDQNTHVKLTFIGDFSALPAGTTDYYGYIAIDIEGIGGEKFRDVTKSNIQPVDSSIWGTRAMITKVSDTEITIESDILYTQIDFTIKNYLITGRLGFI